MATPSRPARALARAQVESKQGLLDEIEDLDPVFGWRGGSPYGEDRPTLVLHRDDRSFPSFAFLQRCLRDTYAELQGGDPTAAEVEFVANEPQVPAVGGRIITLDLTDDDWSPSTSGDRPAIERGGVDIVPTLAELARTLYAGQLGYVVVNVPLEWEGTFRRRDFFERLVEHLADAAPPDNTDETTGAVEKLRTAPVTVARPHDLDPDTFDARVTQYFGFERSFSWTTVDQADAALTNALRGGQWGQVALTQRQARGDESSRHYNWKGLLVDGIARAMWVTKTDRDEPFRQFARDELHTDGPIDTESPIDASTGEDVSAVADVHVSAGPKWVRSGVETFVDEDDVELPLVVEFETGFAEASFQYRKIVESIEKYERTGYSGTVALVVPPRLLYRGARQARLLEELVDAENDRLDDLTATLCVPTLADGTCTGIRPATDVIHALYDDV